MVINGITLTTISIDELCEDLKDKGIEVLAMIWPLGNSPVLEINALSSKDFDKFIAEQNHTKVYDKLPGCFKHLAIAFSHPDTTKLSRHREGEDHEICL